MLSDSMSNIISDFDGSTSQFEELSTQETVSEDVESSTPPEEKHWK